MCDDWGPIFHAEPPDGKIVAQVHFASRLPRVMAKQDYLARIVTPNSQSQQQKCDQNHSILVIVTVSICNIPSLKSAVPSGAKPKGRHVTDPSHRPNKEFPPRSPAPPAKRRLLRTFRFEPSVIPTGSALPAKGGISLPTHHEGEANESFVILPALRGGCLRLSPEPPPPNPARVG